MKENLLLLSLLILQGIQSRCLKIKLLLLFKNREPLLPLVEKHEGKLIKEIGDKLEVEINLNNIGIVMRHDKGDYDKALEYLE